MYAVRAAAREQGKTLDDKTKTEFGDDQQQTAAYAFDMLIGLTSAARQADLTFLAYLLEMAGSEASRVAERKNSDGAPVSRPRAKKSR